MDKLAGLCGREYRLFRYDGHPEAERVDDLHGLRRGGGARDRAVDGREGREGRRAAGAALPAVLGGTFPRRPADDREIHRRARPLQGVGRHGRAALSGRGDDARRRGRGRHGARPCRASSAGATGSRRRNSTRAWPRRCSRRSPRPSRRTASPSASTTTCRAPASTYDRDFDIEPKGTTRAIFYGLGADGTVGANKNSVKILAEDPGRYAQGYFVYDSHKSGAETISHLRFGTTPIRAPYLIRHADFVACHKFDFLKRLDVLGTAREGATFLLNAPQGPDEVWDALPRPIQKRILDRKLKFFVIDATKVAQDLGLGPRINTILQTCFFAISGRAAARRGDRRDQARHREGLWPQGRHGRREELRRGRRGAGAPARGAGAARADGHRAAAAGAGRCAGIRAATSPP